MQTEAMVMGETGGPEVLLRKTIDLAPLAPHEVRVRVRAVALNHLDIWTRKGLPNLKYEFPHRLGSDIAGEIDAVGESVKFAKVGMHVLVNPGLSCGVCEKCLSGADNLCRSYRILGESAQGGYSRHVHVPEANVLPMPSRLSFTEAAAIPLCFLTAWQMVVRRGALRAGQTVLVQAAGSGVSSAAIQIAKVMGARVIATTGSDHKAERARALGADHVINYSTTDFLAETKRLSEKRGVDLVIEHVGGDVFEKSILATAWGGKVVTCGATIGHSPNIDLRQIFFRQVQVLGSTMGSKADLFEVLRLVDGGALNPVIDRTFPLWQAADAHRVLEAREAFGKVVLEVDG